MILKGVDSLSKKKEDSASEGENEGSKRKDSYLL